MREGGSKGEGWMDEWWDGGGGEGEEGRAGQTDITCVTLIRALLFAEIASNYDRRIQKCDSSGNMYHRWVFSRHSQLPV